MLIEENVQNVITNTTNNKTYSIQTTAKAFQILSSGIYKDKIKAVIRELSCNAYDSHVEANKADVPFNVTLPCKIEPSFVVEDFGVGLSKEETENLFTTYFESTKTSSNDVVGAFGLGSKAPFSYTSSFDIVSRKDGQENHFNCHINSSGEPSITHIFSTETSEPNGVRISVPVDDKDIYKFEFIAVEVYEFFKVRPIITNKELEYEFDKDSFYEKRWLNNVRLGSGNLNAVMGNVCYPISKKNIDNDIINHIPTLYIHFDIGELEVTASREELSYTDKTIEVLQNKVDKITKDIIEYNQSEIDKCDNIIEAYFSYNKNPIKYFLTYKNKSFDRIEMTESLYKEMIGIKMRGYVGFDDKLRKPKIKNKIMTNNISNTISSFGLSVYKRPIIVYNCKGQGPIYKNLVAYKDHKNADNIFYTNHSISDELMNSLELMYDFVDFEYLIDYVKQNKLIKKSSKTQTNRVNKNQVRGVIADSKSDVYLRPVKELDSIIDFEDEDYDFYMLCDSYGIYGIYDMNRKVFDYSFIRFLMSNKVVNKILFVPTNVSKSKLNKLKSIEDFFKNLDFDKVLKNLVDNSDSVSGTLYHQVEQYERLERKFGVFMKYVDISNIKESVDQIKKYNVKEKGMFFSEISKATLYVNSLNYLIGNDTLFIVDVNKYVRNEIINKYPLLRQRFIQCDEYNELLDDEHVRIYVEGVNEKLYK